MTGFLRRRALDRRTLLRGSGAALALPWLDAMTAGLSTPKPAPVRSVFVFSPNGIKMDDWTPATTGKDYELPFLLEPLAALRDEFSVLSRLAADAGRSHGDGPGDHARAAATFLTCAHPRKTGGADLRVGTSVDQIIAAKRGHATVFPSLELGLEGGRKGGSCDSGYSCAYSNNIAWRSPTTPMAKEVRPRAAFRRLFGIAGTETADARRARGRMQSVLDAAREDAKRLLRTLGASDQGKLDEYFTSVRSLERRLDKLDQQAAQAPVAPSFWNRTVEDDHTQRLRWMYEIIRLALQTDQTRVVTFMLGNAGSNRSYRFLGVSDGHHQLSHHRGDASKLRSIRKINRYHVEEFARFLGGLATTKEGDHSLLHHATVLFGSGLGDGNRHDHMDLPILVAGRAGGQFHPGTHHRMPKRTPLANLHRSILAAHGIANARFADSTGSIAL